LSLLSLLLLLLAAGCWLLVACCLLLEVDVARHEAGLPSVW